ncbi:hypothetical protein [Nocardia barduliensis]|uniref:hypothetical protein n=1 Tax=Nocardia barduliensis TaxID=2736643 RepID=UPI001574A8F3|nr:hypothetical protein [Nocardia barduliensis]
MKPAWISAVLSMISLLVVVITAAVLLSRPAESTMAYTDDPQTAESGRPPTPPGKYTITEVGNACDLVDLAWAQQLGGKSRQEPTHRETRTGNIGSLDCQAMFEQSSVSFSAYLGDNVRGLYDVGREQTATTGSGRRSGTVPEFGADTYYILVESGGVALGSRQASADVELAVLDGNLHARLSLRASRTNAPLSGDEILQSATNQMRHILERLRA